jgi:hypothetical protein
MGKRRDGETARWGDGETGRRRDGETAKEVFSDSDYVKA